MTCTQVCLFWPTWQHHEEELEPFAAVRRRLVPPVVFDTVWTHTHTSP